MNDNLYLRNLYLKKFNQKVDKLVESVKLLNQVDMILDNKQTNERNDLINQLNSLNEFLKKQV